MIYGHNQLRQIWAMICWIYTDCWAKCNRIRKSWSFDCFEEYKMLNKLTLITENNPFWQLNSVRPSIITEMSSALRREK